MTAGSSGDNESMTAKMDVNAMAAESKRRQHATVTGGASTLDDGTTCGRPFRTDDQLVFLYNIANVNQHPHSLRPAFRVLGLFANADDAVEHGRLCAAMDNRSAFRIGETHAWYTIAKECYHDVEPYRLKVNRNLQLHQEALNQHAAEFNKRKAFLTKGRAPSYSAAEAFKQSQDRVQEMQELCDAAEAGGEEALKAKDAEMAARIASEQERRGVQAGRSAVGDGVEESKAGQGVGEGVEDVSVEEYVEPELKPPVKPEELDEKWEECVSATFGSCNYVNVPRLNRLAEVRNQRYCVVSVVEDYESGEEPGFIVWAAFDSEEDALKYNKAVAAKELKDHDLAIVSMYEWVYPHVMLSDSVEQLYRNEELNNIMKNARFSAKRVRDFERECAERGVSVPVTEVESDLAEPAPRVYNKLIEETSQLDGRNDLA